MLPSGSAMLCYMLMLNYVFCLSAYRRASSATKVTMAGVARVTWLIKYTNIVIFLMMTLVVVVIEHNVWTLSRLFWHQKVSWTLLLLLGYPISFFPLEVYRIGPCVCPLRAFLCLWYTMFLIFWRFEKLWKMTISFVISVCLSVRPHGTTRHLIWYFSLFDNLPRKFKFIKIWQAWRCCTWRHMHVYVSISLSSSSKMKNVPNKRCRDNQTRFMFLNFFPRKSCRLWDNVGKCGTAGQGTDDHIMRNMRFACRITKATDIHFAFPQQKCLRERVSMLRYTYTACVVMFFKLL